jgi:TFIIF-interacting CTD phosphatase-like protein
MRVFANRETRGMTESHLLVLDLDETLVHTTGDPLPVPHQFRVGSGYGYERPGLREFLGRCQRSFLLAVWSASNRAHTDAVVGHIFGGGKDLAFSWARDRCWATYNPETDDFDIMLKDLALLEWHKYDLARVLVVDDSPHKLVRHPDNHIPISPFRGDPADVELSVLATFLETLRCVPDVRVVDKSGWRGEESP